MNQSMVEMWFYLSTFGFILFEANAQVDINNTVTASFFVADAENQTENTNKTAGSENKNIEMQRITQPMSEVHSQSQQIGRTLFPAVSNSSGNGFKPANFKPSPQLDTYYEYNRFPVVPALPEAKHFGDINFAEKPIRSEILPWLDRPLINYPTTTQQPWYNRINFPTTQNPFLSVRDHLYPYLNGGGYLETTTVKSQYPFIITGTNVDTTTRNPYPFAISGTNVEFTTRSPGFGNPPGYSKFGGFPSGNSAGGFDGKLGDYDKGGFFDKGVKNGFGSSANDDSLLPKTHFEPPTSLSSIGTSGVSPWKKIIKFLTAIIPIGLLISALTPTVINVAPNNTTQSRSRAEGARKFTSEQLLSSLNYINNLNSAGCEERVICELLVAAGSSSNAEQHVKNFLQAFTEQERDVIEQIDALNKIFEAVKGGKCDSLPCDGISKTKKTKDDK